MLFRAGIPPIVSKDAFSKTKTKQKKRASTFVSRRLYYRTLQMATFGTWRWRRRRTAAFVPSALHLAFFFFEERSNYESPSLNPNVRLREDVALAPRADPSFGPDIIWQAQQCGRNMPLLCKHFRSERFRSSRYVCKTLKRLQGVQIRCRKSERRYHF